MRKLTLTLVALALAGCAQWREMTPKERAAVVGVAVVVAVLGAESLEDDDTLPIQPPSKPWQLWRPPGPCAPGKICR